MYNRRDFLKGSGALALGSMLLPGIANSGSFPVFTSTQPIGIQLFTLFTFMGTDVKGSFQKLADIGFRNIESAFSMIGPYYGYTPKDLKLMIEGMGMKWVSHHVLGAPFKMPAGPPPNAKEGTQNAPKGGGFGSLPKMSNLRDNLQQLVDEAAEGGLEFLVCASTPIGTMDDIKASIETFQKAGEACKNAGIQFVYHNHATEFDPVEGGKSAYELILSQTDKDLVKMELDLAWAAKAKQDPVVLFKGNPGRFPLWHVKDFDLVNDKIVAVGMGQVDFKSTFAQAKLAGMKYFFYEQDTAKSMDDIKLSYDNILKIIS